MRVIACCVSGGLRKGSFDEVGFMMGRGEVVKWNERGSSFRCSARAQILVVNSIGSVVT